MTDTTVLPPSCDFSSDWMAWLALRHFLSAHLLRELVGTVVAQAGYDMGDLFEEAYHETELWNEGWIVRPHAFSAAGRSDYVRGYYIRMVESLVAQNDAGGYPSRETSPTRAGGLGQETVDLFVRFGAVDLSVDLDAWNTAFATVEDRIQPSFKALLNVLTSAIEAKESNTVDLWSRVRPTLAPLGMPLEAVFTKHIADLLADSDAWELAMAGYETARDLYEEWSPGAAWKDVSSSWKTSVIGSLAAALAVLQEDPGATAAVLEPAAGGALAQDPMRAANLTIDAAAGASPPPAEGHDSAPRHCTIMKAPLLVHSHNDRRVVNLVRQGQYEAAGRRFWALLRRQHALGAARAARSTKSAYAWGLLTELSAALGKEQNPDAFKSAMRMLLESGDDVEAERLAWSGPFLATYVDDECVAALISHAAKYKGSRISRERVLLTVFTAWACECRTPGRESAVLLMWRHVAALAQQFPAKLGKALDMGRPSLTALKEIAQKRPELRANVSEQIQQALCARLGSTEDFWMGRADACEAIAAYADAFSPGQLEQVLQAVLNLLATIDTRQSMWPVTRPALALFVGPAVTNHVKHHSRLGPEIVREILRIGLDQESERRNILFYLHDFDAQLLTDPQVVAKLSEHGIVSELAANARRHGSSLVGGAISSLLLAPSVSGHDGVEAALLGLHEVLKSASEASPSVGLAMAYGTLLSLLNTRAKLEEALPDDHAWLDEHYRRLLAEIPDVWRAVARRPPIFASFLILRQEHAHPVIVHNWAVASLRFGEAFGQSKAIEEVLRSAAEEAPELARPIHLAHTTRAVTRPIESMDVELARTDDPEVFYANIGRHLAQLRRSEDRDQNEVLRKLLLAQCLRFGPRPVDVAVLLESTRADHLRDHARANGLSDYRMRLAHAGELSLTLAPVLDLFNDPILPIAEK